MDGWALWLFSMIKPVAMRVMLTLGMGIVSYTGVDTAVFAALDAAKGALQGLPLEVAQIMARFGFFDYMAITSGGVVSGLSWSILQKWALRSDAAVGGS